MNSLLFMAALFRDRDNCAPLWRSARSAHFLARQMHRLSLYLLAMPIIIIIFWLVGEERPSGRRTCPCLPRRRRRCGDKLFRLTASEELLMCWHLGHVCPVQPAREYKCTTDEEEEKEEEEYKVELESSVLGVRQLPGQV